MSNDRTIHRNDDIQLDLEKPEDDVVVIESIGGTTETIRRSVQQMSEEHFVSVEKRLKRKLDIRLTGMIVLIYILNYLDRVRLITMSSKPIRSISNHSL